MRVTARGWSRDMGTKELTEFNLNDVRISSDETVYRNKPAIYSSWQGVTVAWCQPMRYMGDYRMDITFSRQDVLKLFRAKFGSELPASLIEEHGFALSPELVKSILKKVKLADLTLGELVSMAATSEEHTAADKPTGPVKVRPLLRTV